MKIEPAVYIFGLIVFLFYVPMFFVLSKTLAQKAARKRFYKAVLTVLSDCQDDFEAIDRIKVAYKRLAEIYPHVATSTKSHGDLLEGFYFRVVSLSDADFKRVYGMEIDQAMRNRLAILIDKFRSVEPFASVSSKFSNLLFMLQRSIESKNEELGESSLSQISQEIEIMEQRMRSQERQNFISLVVSVVGVILTVVFGAISLIPLVKEANKAPEPTPTAVTSPASQETRQP